MMSSDGGQPLFMVSRVVWLSEWMRITFLDHSSPKKGGNDYAVQFIEGRGRREQEQFLWPIRGVNHLPP